MKIYENDLYIEDIQYVMNLNLPWQKLKDKSILISGATGLIGSFLVDVIMKKNSQGLNCKIIGVGRNLEWAKKRFFYCFNDTLFKFVQHDISFPLPKDELLKTNFLIHMASNTHPMQYSMDPIGTVTTNIFGTYNMLEFAAKNDVERCLLMSSNEIYGENRGDVEFFDEHYCGYIDCNTMRAGYPESKRCSESLCQAYSKQKNLDIVIARATRSYGPTLLMNDTKAMTQFIKRSLNGEDIVLKSEGNQFYSYTYVADAVSGILTILLKGDNGEAYNISDKNSDITLKELATIIAEYSNKKVIFEIPDKVESEGYSKATKARLNSDKLKKLGWCLKYEINSGIERTLKILSDSEL